MLKNSALFVMVFAVVFSSCAVRRDVRVNADSDVLREVRCIAVLSFENDTDFERAGEIVADVVASAVLATGKFMVMFRDESMWRVRNQNISSAVQLTNETAAVLGEIMGVDAVLHGRVLKYGTESFGDDKLLEPVVEMEAELVASRSGDVLWRWRGRSTIPLSVPAPSLAAAVQSGAEDMASSLALRAPDRAISMTEKCGLPVDTLDIDGDGILNIVDRCPLEAGEEKSGGCPKDSPYLKFVKLVGRRIFFTRDVAFVRDTAEPLPSSIPVLKGLAELLKRNIFLKRIVVEGYVSERHGGNSDRREELAFARAQAVKNFLIEEGVSPDRVSAVGYGKIVGKDVKRDFVEVRVIEVSR